MNKTLITLMAALAASAGWAGDEVVASDGTMIAVDFRTGVRVVNSDVDIWPIAWSSLWRDGAASATVTSAYDASVTAVPDTPSMPSGSPSRTLVNAQSNEGDAAFVSSGSGLYKFTHTPGEETGEETAWFLLTTSSVDSVALSYDGTEYTSASPRPVNTLDAVWDIAYSGKNWDPAASDGTATLAMTAANGKSVTLKSATGEGDYKLDVATTGNATLTHTAGGTTVTAYLQFPSEQSHGMTTIITNESGTTGPVPVPVSVLAYGGASWLDTDGSGSGEGGEGSETGDSPLLITGIESQTTDQGGLQWRISFRPRLKGGAKNLEAWYRASQLNGMIRLRRASTRSGLDDEKSVTTAASEIKQPDGTDGLPEEVVLVEEALDDNRSVWKVEIK